MLIEILKNNNLFISLFVALAMSCTNHAIQKMPGFESRTDCKPNKKREVEFEILTNPTSELLLLKYSNEFKKYINKLYYPCVPQNFTIYADTIAHIDSLKTSLFVFSEGYRGELYPRGVKKYKKLLLKIDDDLFFLDQENDRTKIVFVNYIRVVFPEFYKANDPELIMKGLQEIR